VFPGGPPAAGAADREKGDMIMSVQTPTGGRPAGAEDLIVIAGAVGFI